MDKRDISKQVEELAEQFRADSLYSIDYGRNAKAIAFSNADVRKKVAEIVGQGYVITAVRPIAGFGSSLINFKLGVEFESADSKQAIVKKNKAVIITVEIPTRKVAKILEANSLVSDLPVATPFATINPNPNAEVRTSASEMKMRREIEANYLGSLGIPGMGSQRPGVKDPMDPSNPLAPDRGTVIINPGGPFGGGRGGQSEGSTVEATGSDTPVQTQTGCETESEGIGDDSANDDADYDGSHNDDVINDGEHPDYSAFRRFF